MEFESVMEGHNKILKGKEGDMARQDGMIYLKSNLTGMPGWHCYGAHLRRMWKNLNPSPEGGR